ncbi:MULTISPECIES: anthrax toxin-like adenylyl cyclase domain-containing protein [unclassified Providencia]|uniref:anthrax toxin-like adenylyl cyclase domain-containing protein n=1 Tax=unclassified Providencia TaxID=2633465 RepID=UPI0020115291|nr:MULTISPECIES: anthrax toxin-like adenylyl cyclase domain-containing protein [unclassified Providencia]
MDFGQVNLHLYANSIENEMLRNKLLSEYGISHTKAPGYCYGLSNEYLIYASNNQHIDYIKQLNTLLDVVNNHETGQDALRQTRSDALKIHAKALLNEFVFDAVKHQEIYESSVRNYNYFEQTTYEDINGRSFKDYIDYVINTTYEDSQFKGEYYKSVTESQKIKSRKYYSALIADDNFFKSNEGLEISKDPLFIKLKEHFSEINRPMDKNFTKHDAKIFLKVIFNDIQRDNYTKAESLNTLRGMKRDQLHKGSKYDNHFKKEISLNEFIMKLNNETSHGHDPLRYKFCSETHVMAITADFNTATKSWEFTFFDPILGIKKYDNQEEFFNFLKDFVLNQSDSYNFNQLKNNDFKIGYYKYNYDGNVNLRELNESEIKITENILLAEREVSIDINDRDRIIYKGFNPEERLIKIKSEINGKTFHIYTDVIDSFELNSLIERNSMNLSELGGDIFISRNEGLVYKVDKNFDINDFNIESKLKLDLNNTKVNYKDINLELRPINSDDRKIITGIPESHQTVIAKIANEENIIIGIRPVDKKSASLILSGEYSSKGLKIKSKSSDWGPHCGFIPVLQEYAKRSGRENKNKYNSYTQLAIDDGYAKSTILELTPERVNELTVYNEIKPLETVNSSEYSKTISILDEQEKVFLLKKINRDGKYFWHVYHEDDGNIKPFHVIADPITGKAMTADYDLFSIIFPISELEHYVKVSEMPTWAEWKASVNYNELTSRQKAFYTNEAEYNKHEGRDNGITNNRIKEIKNKLNKGLDRTNGMELIHHGADDANPASVMKENFPITFFLPEKLKARNTLTGSSEAISTYFQMNAQGAIIINDVEQLSNFQQLLINQGYRAPLNKKWSEGDIGQYFDPKRKISDSFIEGRIELARKKSLVNPFELNVDVAAIQQQRQHYDSEMERQLILYHSLSKGMITEAAEHRSFTSELEATLKQHGLETKVLSKFTHERGAVSTTKGQQIQALFEKVALGEQDLNAIRLTDHPYLADDFTNEHGNFDQRKFKIALHDPFVNAEYNQSLNKDETQLPLWLSGSIEQDLQSSHPRQAIKMQRLLLAIKNDLSVLNNLSDHSIELLKSLFPAGDGIDKGKILDLVTDHNKFMLFSDKLEGFSQISDSHFDGENAPLKGLSFSEALDAYENNQTQRLKQYNQLLNYQNRMETGYHSGLINHGIIRSDKPAQSIDQTLGAVYAIEYHLTDSYAARNFLEQKAQLERAKQQGILTDSDEVLLDKMQQYEQDINTRVKNSGTTIADQSISTLFSTEADSVNGIVFLKGKVTSYTVIYVKRNGVYEFSLFDPQGIQFTSKNTSLQTAKHQFKQHLKNYFNQTIELADGQSISRGVAAGFQLTSDGDFRTNLQFINLEDNELKVALSEPLNQRTLIMEQAEFNSTQNRWVELNGEKIAFSKLQHLGATIDGKPITHGDMALPNLHKNIRFSPEKLAMYFTLMDGNKDDIAFMKIFNEQLSSADIYQLVERDANFAESGVLKKQFKYLANDVDLQHESISSTTLQNIRQAGTRLPLFHRIANRFGQSMGGAGAIQSLIGAYSILNRLDNPDISAEEAKELEKQFYLLCASAFFNYGDMIIQPMLLNIASNKNATSLVRARISIGVVVIFNLVGMGIDIYQAYDSLSKLDSVTDPKQRQDLIVNASFSIVSAVVNGVTVIAVLVGASSVPVAGLVIGGILLVGGWVYNGVRAVEKIKAVIDIDWDRELEEGIRGALGLEPTLRSQQEMSTQLYINAFKEQEWQMDLAQFRNGILQAGFDHHLTVIEKPTYENEPRYYLVDDYGNHFYGTLANVYHGMHTWVATYTAKGAPSFTEEEVEFIFANKVIRKTAWYRNLANLYGDRNRNLREHFRPHKKAKEVIDQKRTGSVPTHERYYLNLVYKNPLLDEFQTRHRISNGDATLSLEDQLAKSAPEQLSFYSKKREFGVLGQQILRENERLESEHLVNDKKGISLYLKNPYSRGTSWNTGNGNDLLIGHQEQKNAFQVLSGEKYFAGGNKDDLFYIRDSSLTSLRSRDDNKPTKYLDGQQGQDTIVVDGLPEGYDVHANLALNSLHYKHQFTYQFISVAHLQSIENILIKGNSNDQLRGNDMANILDGGLGKDLLIGEGGNDKLILTQGTAVGGQGDDSYHIRRFDWTTDVDNLYLTNRYWDRKLKAVKTKTTLNPIYQHNHQQYHVKVVIDESSQSQSIVSLAYSLNEIKQVYLQDNNLYLVISLPSSKVDDFTYSNVESSVTIVLNNVTTVSQGQQKASHTYRLHTKDGFVMTSQIKALDEGMPTQFFNISYIQENDQLTSSDGKSVKIDETLNAITINQNRHHIAPSWGWFTPVGRADNLVYQGDDKNNLLSLISSGSYIHVSRGIDTYQIVHAEDERSTITFDFASVNGQFTQDDKVILLLPTDNGYVLSMDGLTLHSKDKFGQRQLAINFVSVDDKLTDVILIQDKYSNVFSLDLQTQSLTPLKPVSKSSESADEIILPVGYLSERHIIDGKGGDDIIINKSGESYILIGGEGDDNIKAIDGNNVLYGGAGDNFLSGGEGDDLLLSSQGNDTLMGEAGNDHYVIDGNHSGAVYLEDNLGDNHIHLINFKPQMVEETLGEELYHLYVSQAGKIVKIKQPTDGSKASVTVHHYEQLGAEYFLPTKNGMTPLVDYLSTQQDLAKQSGRLATWKPVSELAETLKGIAKPLKQTAGNDGILIKTPNEHLLIDTLDGDDEIVDHSSQGRVIKGGNGNDKLIAFGGENVLYGGEGNDILLAQGMGQDVLVSLTGNDKLSGEKGDDLYIVSGHGQGNVAINDFEGRNQVALIDFKIDAISYQEVSPSIAETTYQSYSGRTVTLRHNNHQGSMANVMQVSHINNHQKLSQQNVDLKIDRLIQLLAEQRIEHESNLENQSKKNSPVPHWGAVSTTEHFLNVL